MITLGQEPGLAACWGSRDRSCNPRRFAWSPGAAAVCSVPGCRRAVCIRMATKKHLVLLRYKRFTSRDSSRSAERHRFLKISSRKLHHAEEMKKEIFWPKEIRGHRALKRCFSPYGTAAKTVQFFLQNRFPYTCTKPRGNASFSLFFPQKCQREAPP